MADKIKSYDEFIAEIKSSIEFHLEESASHITEANRLKQLLEAANGVSLALKTDAPKTNGHVVAIPQQPESKPATKASFEDVNADILSDGMPKTVKMLSAEYTRRTGTEYDRKDYSAKLANLRKKTDYRLQSIVYEDLPTEHRYWWGLKEWFDGDQLKDEFRDKIYKSLGYVHFQSKLM